MTDGRCPRSLGRWPIPADPIIGQLASVLGDLATSNGLGNAIVPRRERPMGKHHRRRNNRGNPGAGPKVGAQPAPAAGTGPVPAADEAGGPAVETIEPERP